MKREKKKLREKKNREKEIKRERIRNERLFKKGEKQQPKGHRKGLEGLGRNNSGW